MLNFHWSEAAPSLYSEIYLFEFEELFYFFLRESCLDFYQLTIYLFIVLEITFSQNSTTWNIKSALSTFQGPKVRR